MPLVRLSHVSQHEEGEQETSGEGNSRSDESGQQE